MSASNPSDIGAETARPLDAERWIEAFSHVARHYRLPVSPQSARLAQQWRPPEEGEAAIAMLAGKLGLQVRFVAASDFTPSNWALPIIIELRDGSLSTVTALDRDGTAEAFFSEEAGQSRPVALQTLLEAAARVVLPCPARKVTDSRVDGYIRAYQPHWLREIVLSDLSPYAYVMLASFVANLLGLAGILFSMQVYDRVIPSGSFPTLYVLFAGVLVAILFDFTLRRMRMRIIDLVGKQADRRMSDAVFGHALRVRSRARPESTGTFIAQLRDLEQVRELLTSTTVAAIADIPFFVVFALVFWYIAGPLVLIPLVALLLMVLPGILVQSRLRAHATAAMRESSLRNATLIEAIQGLEDIKTLQAEERFQQQWNHYCNVTSEANLRLRNLTNTLSVWSHNVQFGVFAAVVCFGAPMAIAGDLTTGALVAASVLGSRMMAPMAQFTQVLSRLQQARLGMQGLNQIMQLPVDAPPEENRIHCPAVAGEYTLHDASFRYGTLDPAPALSVARLQINAGEKVAVLGRNGAGKSTLLQALSGLLEPDSGSVLLDRLALQHIDPVDVRRSVGLLSQNARLFHGTLCDNLLLGAPNASQETLIEALEISGAHDFIRKLPRGLEHIVQEGGIGLSGGQRQSLLLARLLIRQPTVVLLDEPTSGMDEATEQNFIRQFVEWSRHRTVIIATHRMRVLDMLNRVIVLENGRIALDDDKENALRTLRGITPAQPSFSDRTPRRARTSR